MKNCIVCEAGFLPETDRGKYCSDKCRQKAYRGRIMNIVEKERRRKGLGKPPVEKVVVERKETVLGYVRRTGDLTSLLPD